jgi:hypothetical protein
MSNPARTVTLDYDHRSILGLKEMLRPAEQPALRPG